ncbi:6-bladed beta-propeller, partial [Sphingobacterium griseoflavum]
MAQNKENNHTDSVLTREFRISPAHAQHKTMQEVVEEIEYIPLESSKKSEFSINSAVLVDKDRILVYHFFDYDNHLLIFDTTGKLIRRVDIPKDWLNTKKLFLDRVKQEIYISDLDYKTKTLVYNYNGALLRDDQILPYKTYGKIGDSYISYKMHRYRIDKNTPYDLLYYNGMEISDRWMHYKRDTSELLDEYDYHILFSEKLPILSTSYDYKLHFLGEAGIDSVYRFVLPKNLSVPDDFLDNKLYIG